MQLLIVRGLVWLATELILSMVELDHLADYSEFLSRLKDDMALQRDKIVRLMSLEEGNLVKCPVPAGTAPIYGYLKS